MAICKIDNKNLSSEVDHKIFVEEDLGKEIQASGCE
jgi:hypothetical protein